MIIIKSACSHRCGKDLIQLFCSPAVQHFYSTPMHLLHSSKAIYQAGALRKVCLGTFFNIYTDIHCMQAKGVSVYQDLCVHLSGHGMVPLQSLHSSLTVSVPAQHGHLVSIGEYVCYSDIHEVRMPHFGP